MTPTVAIAIPQLSRGGSGGVQGGPEGVILTLLHNLDPSRVRPVLILSEPGSNLLDELPSHVEVLEVSRFKLPNDRYPVIGFARATREAEASAVLSTLRMNVTATTARKLVPGMAPVVCRIANHVTSTVETNRLGTARLKNRAVAEVHRQLLRNADLLISQSTSMSADIVKSAGGSVAGKLTTIPNPVDVDGIQQRSLGEAPPLGPGSPHLISVGRLHRQKGYDLLIRAVAELVATHPDLSLTIVGEGPDRAQLEQLVDALGVAEHVHLIGFTPNPLPLVRAADLYICSSRYEGFSNALAEALALGVPVVAVDGPAAGADLVRPTDGVLVAQPTVADLVSGIGEALDNLGSYSRDAIVAGTRERFSPGRVAERYAEILESAVALRQR